MAKKLVLNYFRWVTHSSCVGFIPLSLSIRYGLVWICTTLVFVLSSLGNCATYLVKKRTDSEAPWVFDVNYINLAASLIYGYAIIVPVAFYFSLRYMGSRADLLRFWCLWGYSLFVFVPTTVSVSLCLIHKWLCSLVLNDNMCRDLYNQPNSHWSICFFSFHCLFQWSFWDGWLYS